MDALLGAYYFVQYGSKAQKIGPVISWQRACLDAFGIIAQKMRIKPLGKDTFQCNKKKWLDEQFHIPDGWFVPMLLNDLEITLDPTMAMGPPEISQALKQIADKVLAAKDLEELKSLHEAAMPMLRFTPIRFATMFADMYNAQVLIVENQGNANSIKEIKELNEGNHDVPNEATANIAAV